MSFPKYDKAIPVYESLRRSPSAGKREKGVNADGHLFGGLGRLRPLHEA